MLDIALVAAGGALGASLRHGAALVIAAGLRAHPLAGHAATLSVNLAGCLAIGMLVPWLVAREDAAAGPRLFLIVGLLGSFTTFSAFGHDTLALVRDGRHGLSLAYVAAHLALGLAAVAAGAALAAGRGA